MLYGFPFSLFHVPQSIFLPKKKKKKKKKGDGELGGNGDLGGEPAEAKEDGGDAGGRCCALQLWVLAKNVFYCQPELGAACGVCVCVCVCPAWRCQASRNSFSPSVLSAPEICFVTLCWNILLCMIVWGNIVV